MQLKRSSANIFASSLALGILLLIALPAGTSAQQAADNSTGSLSMPLSFILDNALDSQAQDIQENIFEYKFNASARDPALQSSLIQDRSDQLTNDANDKKAFLQALMKKNGTIPEAQVADMAYSVGASVDRLGNWSKKLEDHAAGLTMLSGHQTYTNKVLPLIHNIQNTKDMSENLKNKNKGYGVHGNNIPKKK